MSDVVVIKSKDRSTGTPSNGVIQLSEITKLLGTYRAETFIIPNTIYNVTVSNNKIYWDETSGLRTATIPNGFYTASELAGEVEILMNAVGVETYTVTYQETLHKFLTACSTGVFAYNFVDNTTDSAGKLLGYPSTEKYVASIASVSIDCLDLNPTPILYVNFYGASQDLLDTSDNFSSFYVNIDTAFSDVVRQDLISLSVYMSFSSRFQLEYQITDDTGKIMDLNGAEWIMVLVKFDDT